VTLILTLNQVILHTVVHHSSTSTYAPNFIETKRTFCGRTNVHTYARTYAWTFETGFIRSTLSKSHPNNKTQRLSYGLLTQPAATPPKMPIKQQLHAVDRDRQQCWINEQTHITDHTNNQTIYII